MLYRRLKEEEEIGRVEGVAIPKKNWLIEGSF